MDRLKQLGRYVNLTPLDGGGMGTVYLAEHELMDGTFAVKVLSAELVANNEAIKRFQREWQIVSRLNHQNIVRSYEPGCEGGTWFLPMEWIQGESLQRKIEKFDTVDLQTKLRWAMQILSALEATHSLIPPVVHRDIKPSNIMVTDRGLIKLLDFGIAHEVGSSLTQLGNPGTPEYQAPEQLPGFDEESEIDPRTDLFSLGIVLYALLTGLHPFKERPDQPVLATQTAILRRDPEPLTDVDPGIPAGVNEIILRALRKSPAERFQSAAEMLQSLKDYKQVTDAGRQEITSGFVRQMLDAAERCLRLGDFAEARACVEKALAVAPDSSDATLMQERVDGHEAEAKRVQSLIDRAELAMKSRRITEARSLLRTAESVAAGDSKMRLKLRELDSKLRVLEKDGESFVVDELAAIGIMESAEELDGALRAVESLLAKHPLPAVAGARRRIVAAIAARSVARRIELALKTAADGDVEKAGEILAGLLLEDPTNEAILVAFQQAGLPHPACMSTRPWKPVESSTPQEWDRRVRALEKCLGQLEVGLKERQSAQPRDLEHRLDQCRKMHEALVLEEPDDKRLRVLHRKLSSLARPLRRSDHGGLRPGDRLLEAWDNRPVRAAE